MHNDPSRDLAPARLAVGCALFASFAPSLAVGTAAAAERLEGIEVVAPRSGRGDVAVDDYTGTRTRIDGTTLERRDVTLDDVLAREAGVQRRSSGGFGSFASITVRAASAAQTAVLLDGVRLDSAGAPVVDLATLDLLNLAAIDVYRGTTPIEFGAGAIGGAVDLVTPAVPDGESRTRIGLAAGSFGYGRWEAAHAARRGAWDVIATLAGTRADNDFGYVDDNGTPLNDADDRRVRRENAGAERLASLVKIGKTHDGGARTDALLQLGARRLEVPELRNARDNEATFDTDSLQLQIAHAHTPRPTLEARHTVYLHAQEDRFADMLGQVGLGRQDTETESATLGLDTDVSRPFDDGTLALAASLRRETLVSEDAIGRSPDADAERWSGTLGLQWSGYAFDGRLVWVPAASVLASDDTFDRQGGNDDDRRRVRRSVTTVSPSVGLRFDAGETLTIHSSLAAYRREPGFAELFIDRGVIQGNPDLVAERGKNADLGIDWHALDSPTRSLRLGATAFASARDEQIVTVFDARGVGRAVNAGEARIVGLELVGDWRASAAWSGTANLTLQDARNVSPNPVLDERQLPGEARVNGFAAVRWRARRELTLRLEAEWQRGRWYDQANRRPAEDVALAHAGIAYERGPWRTDLSVTNLADRIVEDFNGFPRPGRAATLSVGLRL